MGKSGRVIFFFFAYYYCTDLPLLYAYCGYGAHDNHHNEGVLRENFPEELVEEEDMVHYEEQDEGNLSGLGLWASALGCSLLVSLASLGCLVLLQLIFMHGIPSKSVVDSLALFGARAMLWDAFLHQLPHAFGREHSHSHDHHDAHSHSFEHSHSLKNLSVGLSILASIVLFLHVEKMVRYNRHNFTGGSPWVHGHNNHPHNSSQMPKHDVDRHDKKQWEFSEVTEGDGPA